MGHVVKRANRPKPYVARWIDPSGRERSKSFKRKLDADTHLVSIESSKLRGDYIDANLARITLAEYSETVRQHKVNQRPSTKVRDETYFRSLILPYLGQVPIGQIDFGHIKAWLAQLDSRGCAPATIRKAFQLLSSVLREAVKDRRLVRNPCTDIERSALPRTDLREMRFLDRGEIEALACAIDPFYRPLVLVAAATGLRFGELAGLRVKDLDQLRRLIHVREAMTDVEGQVSFGPLKTKASRRTISVPQFVVDLLAERLANRTSVSSDDLVFTGRNGAAVRASNFRQRFWTPAVVSSVGQPCRFHDLRHSHAALLIQAGVHAKVIQRRLGHSSIKTTLDTYGHVFEGLDSEASSALDAIWTQGMAI